MLPKSYARSPAPINSLSRSFDFGSAGSVLQFIAGALQLAFWDAFKQFDDMPPRRAANLAHLLSHLIRTGCESLALFKVRYAAQVQVGKNFSRELGRLLTFSCFFHLLYCSSTLYLCGYLVN